MQRFFLTAFVTFFSFCVNENKFPNIFKQANITLAYKKGYKSCKESYRPMSILPVITKIFEKLLSKEGTMFMYQFLSKYQCSFRRGCIAQHCLLAIWEMGKPAVDDCQAFRALLPNLSKAFDCLPHALLIVKLNTYGFRLKEQGSENKIQWIL